MVLDFAPKHNVVACFDKSTNHSLPYHDMIDFLMRTPIYYAISTDCPIFENPIRDFWRTVAFTNHDGVLSCTATVLCHRIVINEDVIRRVLRFNDEGAPIAFVEKYVEKTFEAMGYELELNDDGVPIPFDLTRVKKNMVGPAWRYLIHVFQLCLSTRRAGGGLDELSKSLTFPICALARHVPFNYSRYILKGMHFNVSKSYKPFLMYPRFLSLIFQSELPSLENVGQEIKVAKSMNEYTFRCLGRQNPQRKFSGEVTALFDWMLADTPLRQTPARYVVHPDAEDKLHDDQDESERNDLQQPQQQQQQEIPVTSASRIPKVVDHSNQASEVAASPLKKSLKKSPKVAASPVTKSLKKKKRKTVKRKASSILHDLQTNLRSATLKIEALQKENRRLKVIHRTQDEKIAHLSSGQQAQQTQLDQLLEIVRKLQADSLKKGEYKEYKSEHSDTEASNAGFGNDGDHTELRDETTEVRDETEENDGGKTVTRDMNSDSDGGEVEMSANSHTEPLNVDESSASVCSSVEHGFQIMGEDDVCFVHRPIPLVMLIPGESIPSVYKS